VEKLSAVCQATRFHFDYTQQYHHYAYFDVSVVNELWDEWRLDDVFRLDNKSFEISAPDAITPYRDKVVIESVFRDIK
jgi:oligoribonuclease (3'-5' exoribonuclease)